MRRADTTHELHAMVTAGRKFGCIYADPPWAYDNAGSRSNAKGEYRVETTDDIIAKLPVAELAADACHLHLWTTNAFLFDAKRMMEAWGFDYRSIFVWVKPRIGMGNYWRVSHEFLLLGIKGDCKSFADQSLRSWGEFDRQKHSQKPEQVRHMIERVSPGPRLELFGRRRVEGWTVWGNEVPNEMQLSITF